MTRFFRESLLGILLLSIAGSLLASWLAPYFPSPTADGTKTFFFQSIPVAILFPYSIALVMVFAVLTKRWQDREQQRTDVELADVRARLKAAEEARDSLQREFDANATIDIPMANLMRFVAVVLSAPNDAATRTPYEVCRQTAGLAGPGFQHDTIGTALGRMLEIGAVRASYAGLELAIDWQAKLKSHLGQDV